MQNFMKTIINAVQSWTKKEIKNSVANSVADWNQNDSSAVDYVKNRTHWEENGIVHKLDSKYLDLPTNLATIDYVQEAMDVASAAQTTADSKMDANNPSGTGSFSMNRKSDTTVGTNSVTVGYNSIASGNYSHAEGNNAIASGESSHAEGRNTVASGESSHAEGRNTVASGESSHAEGSGYSYLKTTTASGVSSHAEGRCTKASGDYSHAEGSLTTASGVSSHAEGSSTTASGVSSHAEGGIAKASGDYSHAEGYDTVANSYCQHVQGEFNIIDTESATARGKYAHIVGNGTDNTVRSNAHTLDWEGNAWYSGDVYVGSTSGTNIDEGSKKLATEEYVNSAKSFFTLTDDTTSCEYIIRIQNGNLTSTCKASSLTVATLPTKTTYTVGETLDLTDMVVTLTRQNGATEEIDNYTYTEPDMSVAGSMDVTVSYTEAGETYSAIFAITVTEATTTEETESTT